MKIIIKNDETGQYIGTMTMDRLMQLCNGDEQIYNDYIRHLKGKSYVKSLHEIWELVEEN